MKEQKITPKSIDQYLGEFPDDIKEKLQQIRKTISSSAPQAVESISYGIPTFKLEGNLVHFAGFKNHIGFYPTPGGILAFAEDLKAYESAKGSVQFPLDKDIPLDLISRIVKFRVTENIERTKKKKTKKKCKNGHTYYKSSDCPTCPVCENAGKPQNGFLAAFSAPARRALEAEGILTPQQLSAYTQKTILSLHGIGPASLPALIHALNTAGLSFKNS